MRKCRGDILVPDVSKGFISLLEPFTGEYGDVCTVVIVLRVPYLNTTGAEREGLQCMYLDMLLWKYRNVPSN